MSSKIRPDDWDRLFAPSAPRRGGPLRALITILVTVIVIALLGVGTTYALNIRQERFAQAAATATAYAPTAAAVGTATALVEQQATAALVSALTATAQAKQTTPTPTGGLAATIANGGNVRETPISGRPLDQVNAGETVRLLAKTADGKWFKVTYARNQATITGWISRTLLTIDPAVEQQVPEG
ncbi:MAG: SH3 domain-containing protein [Roseiflexaceae bacterium]